MTNSPFDPASETAEQPNDGGNDRSPLNKALAPLASLVKETEENHKINTPGSGNIVTAVHYTSVKALISILSESQYLHYDNAHGHLRLYSSERSNDPQEGCYLRNKAQELAERETVAYCDAESLNRLIWPSRPSADQNAIRDWSHAFIVSFITPGSSDAKQAADQLPFGKPMDTTGMDAQSSLH